MNTLRKGKQDMVEVDRLSDRSSWWHMQYNSEPDGWSSLDWEQGGGGSDG